MRLLSILGGLALALLNVVPAAAADPVRFTLCYDLSKAYTFVTPQIAQAVRDLDALQISAGLLFDVFNVIGGLTPVGRPDRKYPFEHVAIDRIPSTDQ